jgi:hypothetical protein
MPEPCKPRSNLFHYFEDEEVHEILTAQHAAQTPILLGNCAQRSYRFTVITTQIGPLYPSSAASAHRMMLAGVVALAAHELKCVCECHLNMAAICLAELFSCLN